MKTNMTETDSAIATEDMFKPKLRNSEAAKPAAQLPLGPVGMDAETKAFFAELRRTREERQAAVPPARLALARLVKVCQAHSGQGRHVRAILYSAWNGAPASVADLLCVDWAIRKDLLAVLLAFGHDSFFYDQMRDAFKAAGLFAWFTGETER